MRSLWPSEEGAPGGGREGSPKTPPAASASPAAAVPGWRAWRVCVSQPITWGLGSARLGSAEGARVGSTFRLCFALASALLSWARTSGSNKLKLAHNGEGRAKPQTEPWK